MSEPPDFEVQAKYWHDEAKHCKQHFEEAQRKLELIHDVIYPSPTERTTSYIEQWRAIKKILEAKP